jgi:hypothetical protein
MALENSNEGSGNSGQIFYIKNTGDDDEDGTVGFWFYRGNMPQEIEDVNTITIGASRVNNNQVQYLGNFMLRGTYE